jgi:tRNA(fMet)-specific endonuclease VapC
LSAPNYLWDADTLIHFTRENPGVVGRTRQVGLGRICTSALVMAQFSQFVSPSPSINAARGALLDALAQDIAVHPFDLAAARTYRQIMLVLGHARRNAMDRMIAAHAISLGCTLVTGNGTDMAGIPALEVEDWIAR